MSYNILVTGGAGYLGSILVPDLLAASHKVTVLDNFMFKQTGLNHCAYHPNFAVVKGDIRVEAEVLDGRPLPPSPPDTEALHIERPMALRLGGQRDRT